MNVCEQSLCRPRVKLAVLTNKKRLKITKEDVFISVKIGTEKMNYGHSQHDNQEGDILFQEFFNHVNIASPL